MAPPAALLAAAAATPLLPTRLAQVVNDSAAAFSGVNAVSLSDDARYLATGNFDGHVRVYAVAPASAAARLTAELAAGGAVWSVALSGSGGLLAAGSMDGRVRVWAVDAASGAANLTATLDDAAGAGVGVLSVALSDDGGVLAAGAADNATRVYRVDAAAGTARLAATLTDARSRVASVSLSAGGSLLAAGSADGTARLYEVAEGGVRLTAALPGAAALNCVALSRDGRLLAAGLRDNTTRVHAIGADGRAGARAPTRLASAGVVSALTFGDGSLLAAGDLAGEVRLWTLDPTTAGAAAPPAPAAVVSDTPGVVSAVALPRGGGAMATGSTPADGGSARFDNRLRLYLPPQ